MSIHPTAVIDADAEISSNVEIGPYCVIGAGVQLGDGCELSSHVVIQGPSRIGAHNRFFPFCSIGNQTQDLKYSGEPTYLEIGGGNEFREFITVNRGTAPGDKTIIGSQNHFLAYCHVAHNCVVGDHCVFSNNGTLAGHVEVGDYAIIGGLSAIHQFCRIGAHSMIGGCAKIVQDVPPFLLADGNPASIRAVNVVGLQRRGFSENAIRALRQAQRTLFDPDLNTSQALEALESQQADVSEVAELISFVRGSKRGIIR